MLRKFGSHLRNQWMGALSLFLVVSGGTAYAVTQIDRNSVESRHIVNGQVKSGDVRDEGLTGADLKEETLSQVPSAAAANAAQDADTLDGKDSGDFLGANAAASGDLSGSYPNPTIASGAVTAAKIGTLPAVRAWGAVSALSGGGCVFSVPDQTELPICFFQESYDTDSMYAVNGDEQQTKLTAPRAGLYEVSAGVIWGADSVAGSRQLNIKKNGSEYVAAQQVPAGPAGNNSILNVTGTVRLNQGDFVQAIVWQNSGGDLLLFSSFDSRTFFEMHWIGP